MSATSNIDYKAAYHEAYAALVMIMIIQKAEEMRAPIEADYRNYAIALANSVVENQVDETTQIDPGTP